MPKSTNHFTRQNQTRQAAMSRLARLHSGNHFKEIVMYRRETKLWQRIINRTHAPRPANHRAAASVTAKPKPAPRQAAKPRAAATTTKPPRLVAAPRPKAEARILTNPNGAPLLSSNWISTMKIRKDFEVGAPRGVSITSHSLGDAGERIQQKHYFVVAKSAESVTPLNDILAVARMAHGEATHDKRHRNQKRSAKHQANRDRAAWSAIRAARAQAK